MRATDIIAKIMTLPAVQRAKVLRFVNEVIRRIEDLVDNRTAEKALKEPGENNPWQVARKKLGWA